MNAINETLRLLVARVEALEQQLALRVVPEKPFPLSQTADDSGGLNLDHVPLHERPWARERAILEECDIKLEGLQGYLRGDCQVIQIRKLIAKRIKEGETPSQSTPPAAGTPAEWTSPTRPTVAELIEGLRQQNQTAIVVVDARVGDRYEVCTITRLLLGGIGSFSGTPIVVIEAHLKR